MHTHIIHVYTYIIHAHPYIIHFIYLHQTRVYLQPSLYLLTLELTLRSPNAYILTQYTFIHVHTNAYILTLHTFILTLRSSSFQCINSPNAYILTQYTFIQVHTNAYILTLRTFIMTLRSSSFQCINTYTHIQSYAHIHTCIHRCTRLCAYKTKLHVYTGSQEPKRVHTHTIYGEIHTYIRRCTRLHVSCLSTGHTPPQGVRL